MCPNAPKHKCLAVLERTRLHRLLKDPASRWSENREDVWAIIPEAELRSAGQTGRLPLREPRSCALQNVTRASPPHRAKNGLDGGPRRLGLRVHREIALKRLAESRALIQANATARSSNGPLTKADESAVVSR